MDSVAFEVFGFEVRWYGILIAIGVALAIAFIIIGLKRYKIYNEDRLFGMLIFMLIFGFIGARLYYVLFNLGDYNSFLEVINVRAGGLAFHGGIIAGAIAIIIYGRWKKLDTLRYLDIIGVATLLGQGIGRWGNFFNGEAHGGVVTQEFISNFPKFIQEGMHINGLYYNPTFLYESVSDIIWFIVLGFLLLRFTNNRRGTFLALALIANSFTRAIVENMRTDSLMIGDIRVAVLVSILAIIASVGFLIYIYSKDKEEVVYEVETVKKKKKKKNKKKK